MPITDDQLIAYLLNDADADLAQRIQAALSADEDVQRRLDELRQIVGKLDLLATRYEPPSDLVENTLRRIEAANTPNPVPVRLHDNTVAGAERSRSSFWDSSALCLCVTAICCLLLPTVLRVRFDARKAQCAHNLKLIGSNLFNFAIADPASRFPRVALDGPEAFAGVYTVHLSEAGLPVSPTQLRCPSLIGTDSFDTKGLRRNVLNRSMLYCLEEDELRRFQQQAAGSYAYSLGVVENSRVVAPRYSGRSHFAVLADSPLIENGSENYISHDGSGINICYGDGRVMFISTKSFSQPGGPIGDHPFRNWLDAHEVGVTPDDVSLAPSHFPPLAR